MNVRGLVLIGFSGLCVAAAGLAHDAHRKHSIGQSLASVSQPMRACMQDGITTSSGRVGCFVPVSAAIGKAVFGRNYGGGAAMSRR
jgi:hypothetical protein